MARIARLVVPHLPHHVTQRGNRGERVFFSDDDYEAYLQYLREALAVCAAEVWAWCLMPNHVHLIVVPRDEDGLRKTGPAKTGAQIIKNHVVSVTVTVTLQPAKT